MSKNLTPLYFEEHFEHCEGSLYDGDDFVIWLAEHDTGVARAERERIITLLETRLDDCYEKTDMGGWSFVPALFIALIKGENE